MHEFIAIDPLEKYFREQRVIFLYDAIDEGAAIDVTQKLLYFDQTENKPIIIYINSPGGSIPAAFGIIDCMETLRSKVVTIGHGIVASAAFLIFMVGDERKLYERCTVLSHRFSDVEFGSEADLEAAGVERRRVHQRCIDLYVRYSALKDKSEVEEFLLRESDVYIDPSETIRWGVADEIIKTRPKHKPIKRSTAFRRWLGSKKGAKHRSKGK